ALVLDIGAGHGVLTSSLLDAGMRVIAITVAAANPADHHRVRRFVVLLPAVIAATVGVAWVGPSIADTEAPGRVDLRPYAGGAPLAAAALRALAVDSNPAAAAVSGVEALEASVETSTAAASPGETAMLPGAVEASPVAATPSEPAAAMPNELNETVTAATAAHADRHPKPAPPLARPSVVLYGDSLAWEARHAFEFVLAERPDVRVEQRTFGGTAICDWHGAMADDAVAVHPGLVVVAFSGNNFTPCMADDAGHPLTGAALVERYASDAALVIDVFAGRGVEVVFAGAPIPASHTIGAPSIAAQVNARYLALAAQHDHVDYTDAGAAVLTDDGRWTATLPCLPDEPCAGVDQAGNGVNVVRAPDGLHFCPTAPDAARGVTGECPEWSSGAFRFGAALAQPVIDRW
ncbi:MAG: hypothetical protein AAFY28_15165, partial [Actinomycetota bacterium]